jgi:glycine cleavage system regulatory protein
MSSHLVLTVIGVDKPGLVDRLATTIATAGGSWLGSRMARLSGQFAGIVEVQVSNERAAELAHALGALDGLSVMVTPSGEVAIGAAPRSARLAFVGQDRPGLVQAVSRVLAENLVNVEELETRTYLAAMSGTQVFEAEATLSLPAEVDVAALRERLEAVARDVFVDIHIAEAGDTTAR